MEVGVVSTHRNAKLKMECRNVLPYRKSRMYLNGLILFSLMSKGALPFIFVGAEPAKH